MIERNEGTCVQTWKDVCMLERCQAKVPLEGQLGKLKCGIPAWTLELDALEEWLGFDGVYGQGSRLRLLSNSLNNNVSSTANKYHPHLTL